MKQYDVTTLVEELSEPWGLAINEEQLHEALKASEIRPIIKNKIQITAQNVAGAIGKTTVLMICEQALERWGYIIEHSYGSHSMVVGREE